MASTLKFQGQRSVFQMEMEQEPKHREESQHLGTRAEAGWGSSEQKRKWLGRSGSSEEGRVWGQPRKPSEGREPSSEQVPWIHREGPAVAIVRGTEAGQWG